MKRPIKFTAHAVLWFDRIWGNTYHSVRIVRTRDGAELRRPMEYGYGDAYRTTALEAMARAKWLPPEYRGDKHEALNYERNNNYPIDWNVSGGTKRECIANGESHDE